MERRNLNDVVDELLAEKETKLRGKTNLYRQIIDQQSTQMEPPM